jgi:hypothetical protein
VSAATQGHTPAKFRHYEDPASWTELCSGRSGWASRKTQDRALVTCRNCLKQLERAALSAAGIGGAK